MNNEILDEFESLDGDLGIKWNKIGLISLICVLAFWGIDTLNSFPPKSLDSYKHFFNISCPLFVLTIMIVMSITIPAIFNNTKPKLSKLKIVIYSGVILAVTRIISIQLLNTFSFGYEVDLIYFSLVKLFFILIVSGALFSNVWIHHLRKDQLGFPIILLLITLALIGNFAL